MSLKAETIQLKLSKANSLLSEVDGLMHMRFYTTAVSRLYYSCYHATRALLLSKNIIPKTHKGVIIALHEHFVNQDLFNHEKAAFYSKLMEERMEDDYNDFMILDEAEVVKYIEPSKEYVAYIETILKTIIY